MNSRFKRSKKLKQSNSTLKEFYSATNQFKEVSSEADNTMLIEYYEADNNTNTLKKTIKHFVLASATVVPATVESIIGTITNASDSSMQNRLANATVGFINSTVSESTDWSTGAVVGTTVALGSLAIVSGVGIYCYLSKKIESYNNSLDLSKIESNQ